ncbi:MAG: SRPBCC domain-containing protein [Candidatus Woesearchaeota archaeon]|jgi:uncharacterized protein YndB with AHSA1/START domain
MDKTNQNKDKLIITRVINAPPETVFKAWSEPEQIKKWWGPKGFTSPEIQVDLRKGGKYLYCMRGTEGKFAGKDFWSGGVFKKVDIPNKLVIVDYFTDNVGKKMLPSDYGMDKNFPKESTVTITFDEENMKTRLCIMYRLPKSKLAREAILKSGMKEGWNQSLDKLQELVEKY